MSREEGLALMRRWLESMEGLEMVRRQMPEGSTLEDALRLHRKLKQVRRQPSRVMNEINDA